MCDRDESLVQWEYSTTICKCRNRGTKMAGKVVQLQALTRDGANVNVKCATNHTDIFFSLANTGLVI